MQTNSHRNLMCYIRTNEFKHACPRGPHLKFSLCLFTKRVPHLGNIPEICIGTEPKTFPRGNGIFRNEKRHPCTHEVGMAPGSGRRLALVVHFFDLFDRQFLHTMNFLKNSLC